MRLFRGIFNFSTLLVIFSAWPKSSETLPAVLSISLLAILNLIDWVWLTDKSRRLAAHLVISLTVLLDLLLLSVASRDQIQSLTLTEPALLVFKLAIARFEGPALATDHQNNLAKSSLSELFARTLSPADVQNTGLIKWARSAKWRKNYPQATALFISASTPALYHQKFLAAKPLLDEAMTLVPRLSVADQRQVPSVIDKMLKDLDKGLAMPDGSDKEYLAKNVLQIAKKIPDNTASQRADAIIRLSLIYSYHTRTHYSDARAMLVQLLSELKENSPADLKIDSCLEALVIAYEADEQIEYLSTAVRPQEAQAMSAQLRKDEKESAAQQVLADDRQLASTMADANANAWSKISELTKKGVPGARRSQLQGRAECAQSSPLLV